MKCIECGEKAISVYGGNSYCLKHLKQNVTIYWDEEDTNTK